MTDSGEEADLLLYLEPSGEGSTVRLSIGIDQPKPAWRASVFDAEGKLIDSVSLAKDKQPLSSNLNPGTFIVQVVKDDEILAECRVKITAFA